ncbi:hypothetical protein ACM0P6_07045 [Komagataeibacter sucrofermentans]|uniref:hypothetical protein n=1 Tax=Komagataeibacter sucrofermentans TaxID=1053551 RepID=UPI000DA1FB97|nr:hypothetical protein [Komagataeibacter sucrofermentans]GBQ51085.1 hypothetical protein AA15973_2291 [Komagataeibacter sucrofermentans DSM 15973]
MLERRVVTSLSDDEPEEENLIVKTGVDGKLRYFSKARYEEAEECGVVYDGRGDTFYIDCVEPCEK